MPMDATITPSAAAIRPLIADSPAIEMMMVSEKQISQKNSGGPKFSAILAR